MTSYREMIQPTARLDADGLSAVREWLDSATAKSMNPYTLWGLLENRAQRRFDLSDARRLRPNFRAVLGHDGEQEVFTAFMVSHGFTPCHRCQCTGNFVWGAFVNGRPTHSGSCFKCNGRGYFKK